MQKHEELLIALRKVIRAIDLRSRQLNKVAGLTGPQIVVLQHLVQNSGAMVKEIAQSINLSPATVTSILDRLESKSFITRARSQTDKRKVGVSITTLGEQMLKKAPLPLQEHFLNRFAQLEQWEQSQMVATMQRIASMMDAEDLDAAPLLEVGSIVESNAHN
ncbi:MarR family winged helix-turn-helix transcriptional regulator [Glaciecola sp. 1036]|uniref:MarR family winged helix-turn-helix transcriptional regulator n=1 Tax=Alteromonadaceae TaxID=72275 RepID=UPI003D03227C